jgi:hypothetical protein
LIEHVNADGIELAYAAETQRLTVIGALRLARKAGMGKLRVGFFDFLRALMKKANEIRAAAILRLRRTSLKKPSMKSERVLALNTD